MTKHAHTHTNTYNIGLIKTNTGQGCEIVKWSPETRMPFELRVRKTNGVDVITIRLKLYD